MFYKKETTHNLEDCGRLSKDDISKKNRKFDFWYPRIMTALLAMNLLLQILILAFRWYRL